MQKIVILFILTKYTTKTINIQFHCLLPTLFRIYQSKLSDISVAPVFFLQKKIKWYAYFYSRQYMLVRRNVLYLLSMWAIKAVKIHIFWEDHKILLKFHLAFDYSPCLQYTQSIIKWRFRKILWLSQNICMNFTHLL